MVEPFLMRMAHGATVRTLNKPQDVKKNLRGEYDNRHGSTSSKMLSDEQMLRVCKRFFVALILSKLVQVAPLQLLSFLFIFAKLLILVHIYKPVAACTITYTPRYSLKLFLFEL